jgi:hypothetical protein
MIWKLPFWYQSANLDHPLPLPRALDTIGNIHKQ